MACEAIVYIARVFSSEMAGPKYYISRNAKFDARLGGAFTEFAISAHCNSSESIYICIVLLDLSHEPFLYDTFINYYMYYGSISSGFGCNTGLQIAKK